MTGLLAPALLGHVYLAASGDDAPAGWAGLRALWDEVTDRLALAQAVPDLGVPERLPPRDVLPEGGSGVLAAAESQRAEIWQALASADHDLLRVTVMMAPPRDVDCGHAWRNLECTWAGIVDRLPAVSLIGEDRVLLALTAQSPGQEGEYTAAGDEAFLRTLGLLRDAVPGPSAPGWWRHWDTVRAGSPDRHVWVWEIGPQSADSRQARRLAAVAPEELEGDADYLLWTDGGGTAAPLTRHLMHAARLRRQMRVFDEGAVPRRLCEEIRALVDAASCGPAEREHAGLSPAGAGGLPARLRQAQAAAVSVRATLDVMRLTSGIISSNMEQALSLLTADVAVGPLSEDQHLVNWLRRRLDNELLILDSAVRHALLADRMLAAATAGRYQLPEVPGNGQVAGSTGQRARELRGSAGPCVVIFTALAVEYEAVREFLGSPVRQRAVRGTLYEEGALPQARGGWRVVIVQTGPGNVTAAAQMERAAHVFQPVIALFVGVAGGRKDVIRGDVVVAEKIYDYETGKSTPDGFRPRMDAHKPAYQLVQRARMVARQGRWQQRIKPACPAVPPRAFVKPIAAGAKVITDDQGAVALLLEHNASDALAVETEGHGFLEGAYVNPGIDALVIRGISDMMAGKDQAGDDRWQPIASRHAAAFAVELLDSLGAADAQHQDHPPPN